MPLLPSALLSPLTAIFSSRRLNPGQSTGVEAHSDAASTRRKFSFKSKRAFSFSSKKKAEGALPAETSSVSVAPRKAGVKPESLPGAVENLSDIASKSAPADVYGKWQARDAKVGSDVRQSESGARNVPLTTRRRTADQAPAAKQCQVIRKSPTVDVHKTRVFSDNKTQSNNFSNEGLVQPAVELDLANHAPPKFVRIGGRSIQRNVGISELKIAWEHFAKFDKSGTGLVRHSDIFNIAGGEANTTKLLGSNRVAGRVKRRVSSVSRIEDGHVIFQDYLRLKFPEATDEDIKVMETLVRLANGEKMFSRQYAKHRQDVATKHWERISKGKSSIDVDKLQDFLIEQFPDDDHYRMLKMLSTNLDDLYNMAEIEREVRRSMNFQPQVLNAETCYSWENDSTGFRCIAGRTSLPRVVMLNSSGYEWVANANASISYVLVILHAGL